MTNQELLNRIAELERDAEIKYENHKRIVADLTEQAERWEDDALRLMKERNEALKERDEARRSCCEFAAMVDSADTVVMYVDSNRFHEIAMRDMKSRGWDCFKENGK